MAGVKEFDKDLIEKVVQLRNDGAKWAEVGEQLDIPSGIAILYWQVGTCPKKDRIKDITPKQVVELRDGESLSWGNIVARSLVPESRLRSMYEEETGKSTKGNRIGKGGRHAKDTDVEEKPKAKKAAGKAEKAAPKPKGVKRSDLARSLDDMDDDSVKEFLTGRKIQVSTGDGEPETVTIKAVKAVKKGSISLVDNDTGKARALKIAAITAVSKSVVLKS